MKHSCILCQRDSEIVPLLTLEYRGGSFYICSQHLPVVIHDPAQLIGVLQGAENFSPSEHED